MTVLLNDERLFADVLPFIGDKRKILEELIENAARAGASSIDITLDKDALVTVNDGSILTDWESLLTVASTGHSKDVIEAEKPAGLGIILCLQGASVATFTSGDKQISIDCVRFFADGEYRKVIASQLCDPDSLKFDGFVDGMQCEFTAKDGLFESLLEAHKYNRGLDRFDYYSIDIALNNYRISGGYDHKWLVHYDGVGNLAGTKVGVSSRNQSGVVYWFGKKIDCPALAPFSVVVDASTPVLRPTLPDRKALSNSDDELNSLKEIIENQLADDLAVFIKGVKTKADHKNALNTIKHLSTSFDVEHFTYWLNTTNSSEFLIADALAVYSGEIIIDEGDYNMGSSWIDIPGIFQARESLGGTKMPSSLKKIFTKDLEVTTTTHKDDGMYTGGFGDADVTICSSITLAGGEAIPFVFSDDDMLYVDIQIIGKSIGEDMWGLISDLVEHFIDRESPYGRYKYEDDYENMARALDGNVSARKFISDVYAAAGRPDGGIENISVNLAEKTIDVKFVNGASKQVTIGDFVPGYLFKAEEAA